MTLSYIPGSPTTTFLYAYHEMAILSYLHLYNGVQVQRPEQLQTVDSHTALSHIQAHHRSR